MEIERNLKENWMGIEKDGHWKLGKAGWLVFRKKNNNIFSNIYFKQIEDFVKLYNKKGTKNMSCLETSVIFLL